eukprot:CAMPEP_0206129912 /NCGR_PEP_ID=MMETSP1472-20131121/38392_1 /ASSEMBLY_ACC=CAM_ASM_001108 /TAXON_ID=41880 /ORGANISM="Pycnococcus provasolii, Strain RCC251" /LENGTH=252 /DNA_ID=CAMNT_0053521213 /DNA_START=96 /DNA_END=852 /DNA_ORIENTATION=+
MAREGVQRQCAQPHACGTHLGANLSQSTGDARARQTKGASHSANALESAAERTRRILFRESHELIPRRLTFPRVNGIALDNFLVHAKAASFHALKCERSIVFQAPAHLHEPKLWAVPIRPLPVVTHRPEDVAKHLHAAGNSRLNGEEVLHEVHRSQVVCGIRNAILRDPQGQLGSIPAMEREKEVVQPVGVHAASRLTILLRGAYGDVSSRKQLLAVVVDAKEVDMACDEVREVEREHEVRPCGGHDVRRPV